MEKKTTQTKKKETATAASSSAIRAEKEAAVKAYKKAAKERTPQMPQQTRTPQNVRQEMQSIVDRASGRMQPAMNAQQEAGKQEIQRTMQDIVSRATASMQGKPQIVAPQGQQQTINARGYTMADGSQRGTPNHWGDEQGSPIMDYSYTRQDVQDILADAQQAEKNALANYRRLVSEYAGVWSDEVDQAYTAWQKAKQETESWRATNEKIGYQELLSGTKTDLSKVGELLQAQDAAHMGVASMNLTDDKQGLQRVRAEEQYYTAQLNAVREQLRKEGYNDTAIDAIFEQQRRAANEQRSQENRQTMAERAETNTEGDNKFLNTLARGENLFMNAAVGLYGAGAGYVDMLGQRVFGGIDPVTGERRAIDYNSEAQQGYWLNRGTSEGQQEKEINKYGDIGNGLADKLRYRTDEGGNITYMVSDELLELIAQSKQQEAMGRVSLGEAMMGGDTEAEGQRMIMAARGTQALIRKELEDNGYSEKEIDAIFRSTSEAGRVADAAYQGTVSMLQSAQTAALTAVGVPEAVGLVMMSMPAATQTAQEYHEQGYSDGTALLMGAIAGTAEYATEKMSIDALFKARDARTVKNMLKATVLNLNGQGLSEMGEEITSSAINLAADMIVNGDRAMFYQGVPDYMEQGMTEEQAKQEAFKDWFKGELPGWITSYFTGVIMGGGSMAIQSAANARSNRAQGQQIIDNKQADALRSMAEKIDAQDADIFGVNREADTGNAKDVGNLNRDALLARDAAEIREALEKNGETATPELVRAVWAKTNDQRLTKEEARAWRESKNAHLAVEQIRENNEGKMKAAEVVARMTGKDAADIMEEFNQADMQERWGENAAQNAQFNSENVQEDTQNEREATQNAGFDTESEAYQRMKAEKKITQKTVREMDALGKKLGVQIRMEEQVDNGKANGMYQDGVIYIAADAEDPMKVVAIHEAVHRLKETQPELYQEMENAVMDVILKGKNANKLLNEIAQAYELKNDAAGIMEGREEITAQGLGVILGDSDLLSGMAKENRTVIQRILDTITDLLERLQGYSDAEGKVSDFDREAFRGLTEQLEGYKGALQYALEVNATEEENVANHRPMPAGKEASFSRKHNEEYMEAAKEMNDGAVDESVMQRAQEDREYIKAALEKESVLKILPEDIEGNTSIGNSSYGYSQENGTICTRSMAVDGLLDQVSEDLGRPLTFEESMFVCQEAMNYTDKPECLYCYVANDRKAYTQSLGKYFDQRDAAIKAHNEGRDNAWIAKELLGGAKLTKTLEARLNKWFSMAENGEAMLQPKDVAGVTNEANRAAKKRASLPEALRAEFDMARKYAQSASHAKGRNSYVAYDGNILKMKQAVVNTMNRMYGMRMYSFTDYSPAFILENMQMITDAAVRKLKVLAYTKELGFVRVFGDTGANINISTFAMQEADADGNFHQDAMQGAEWEEARKLREESIAKGTGVGITFVATSDAQVDWALAQDWIDVVIPYHSVFTGGGFAARMFGWSDYKSMQEDKKNKDWTKGNKKTIYPSEHNNDLITYAQACYQNNLTPRFSKWLNGYYDYVSGNMSEAEFIAANPNYMKLVNETRRGSKDTPPVQPVFKRDAAQAEIDEMEKRGTYYQPIGVSFDENGEATDNSGIIAQETADKIQGEEFREYIKAQQELREKLGGKRSVKRARDEYRKWVENGEKEGQRIYAGETPDGLRGINMEPKEVFWSSSKIIKIKGDHPEMTDGVFEQIPELIEAPIIVMQSKSVVSRITMFGEVYAENGLPVFGVIELNPTSRAGYELDEYRMVNSYSLLTDEEKEKNTTSTNATQKMLDTGEILFVDPDKKRTDTWLSLNRLQLPFEITEYGSIGTVAQMPKDVNGFYTVGETNGKTAMQLAMEKAKGKKSVKRGEVKAETGVPYKATLFHGKGKTRAEIYTNNQLPVAGEGRYYAMTEDAARNYGDDISTAEVELKQPYVVRDDADWGRLWKDMAGNKYGNPTYLQSDEAEAFTKSIREALVSAGYDGLIVQYESMIDGDYNGETGNVIKTIDRVFGHDQVVVYKQGKADAPFGRNAEGVPYTSEEQRRFYENIAEDSMGLNVMEDKEEEQRKLEAAKRQIREMRERKAKAAELEEQSKAASGQQSFDDALNEATEWAAPHEQQITEDAEANTEEPAPEVTGEDIDEENRRRLEAMFGTLPDEDAWTQEAVDRMAEELGDGLADIAAGQSPVQTEAGREKISAKTEEEKQSWKQRATKAWDAFKRSMVNQADSIHQMALKLKDPSMDGYFFYAKAHRQRANDWVTKKRTSYNGNKVGKSLNEIMNPIREKGDDYYTSFQSYMYHMLNVDRFAASNQEEVWTTQAALDIFVRAHPNIAAMTEERLRALERTLDDVLVPDESMQDAVLAREYLQLKKERDIAANRSFKPVFGYEVTGADSEEAAKKLLVDHPEFEQLAQEVYDYIDDLLQFRVDSGLITENDKKTLQEKYPHYVPAYYDMEQNDSTSWNGNANVSKTIRRAKGGNQTLKPLHTSLAQQTGSVMFNSGIEKLATKILDQYEANWGTMGQYVQEVKEMPHYWDAESADNADIDAPNSNVISVIRDGKRYEVTLDDGTAAAFRQLTEKDSEMKALNFMKNINDTFKKLCTAWNPLFMITNPLRDVQDALFYSTDTKNWAKNYAKTVSEIANNGEYWTMYSAMGGIGSSYFDWMTGETEKETGGIMGKIEAVNLYIEQMPRLAEFMTVLENAKKNHGEITEDDRMNAFNAAQEITTNFGRTGKYGSIINKYLVPFWNPSVQGMSKAVRTVAETKGAKAWVNLTFKAAALGILPSIINGMLYRKDDEWDKIKDSDKINYYLFKGKDGIWVKIPKGRVLAALSAGAVGLQEFARGDDVDWVEIGKTAVEQIAPNNPFENNIVSQMMRTDLFDPNSPGKTWYGSDIESQRLRKLSPGERYDESTDVISKWLGKRLNLSPKKISYLIDQYSGVLGDVILPYLTPKAERGVYIPVTKDVEIAVPLSNAFLSRFTIDTVSNNKISGEYYDMADELTYAKNDGSVSGTVASQYMSHAGGAISDIYAQIREIENDPNLTNKEKTELTRELRGVLNEQQMDIMANADRYRQVAEQFLQAYPELDYSSKDAVQAWMDSYNAKQSGEQYYIDAEKATTKMKEELYREVNRITFGAEYALQTYNKDVYYKALELNQTAELSFDDYYQYYFASQYIYADKDENGNSISGSKKQKMVGLIDSMDVTAAQKDALFLAAGYGESTLGSTPWHGGEGVYVEEGGSGNGGGGNGGRRRRSGGGGGRSSGSATLRSLPGITGASGKKNGSAGSASTGSEMLKALFSGNNSADLKNIYKAVDSGSFKWNNPKRNTTARSNVRSGESAVQRYLRTGKL